MSFNNVNSHLHYRHQKHSAATEPATSPPPPSLPPHPPNQQIVKKKKKNQTISTTHQNKQTSLLPDRRMDVPQIMRIWPFHLQDNKGCHVATFTAVYHIDIRPSASQGCCYLLPFMGLLLLPARGDPARSEGRPLALRQQPEVALWFRELNPN